MEAQPSVVGVDTQASQFDGVVNEALRVELTIVRAAPGGEGRTSHLLLDGDFALVSQCLNALLVGRSPRGEVCMPASVGQDGAE